MTLYEKAPAKKKGSEKRKAPVKESKRAKQTSKNVKRV